MSGYKTFPMAAASAAALLCCAVHSPLARAVPLPGPLTGTTIVIDPGHPGVFTDDMNKPVDNGRGGTSPCQTRGTSSPDGYAEHTFNWEMAGRIAESLRGAGATVKLTRADDSSAGQTPCIDQRVEFENSSGAAAVISVHADGNTAGGSQGFHVIYADPPSNEVQKAGQGYANNMRDALVAAGLSPSNYAGVNGTQPRSDLVGITRSTVPKVLIEFANMLDESDLAWMKNTTSRGRYAAATAQAVSDYARGSNVPAVAAPPPPAPGTGPDGNQITPPVLGPPDPGTGTDPQLSPQAPGSNPGGEQIPVGTPKTGGVRWDEFGGSANEAPRDLDSFLSDMIGYFKTFAAIAAVLGILAISALMALGIKGRSEQAKRALETLPLILLGTVMAGSAWTLVDIFAA